MAKKIETIFSIQDKYTKTMNKIINSSMTAEKKINKVSYATDKFNQKMNKIKAPDTNKITSAFDKIKNKATTATSFIGGLVKAIASLATAKIAINTIDTTTLTNSRLNMINDEQQTDKQLQNKIMQSANNSRGVYSTTASNVAKLGLLAGDNFNNNDEIIRFSELLNKSFKVGGASTQEQEAGTYQLTQAMAAGKLQGDEFRSIMENAPLVAQAIADYTGKTKGELKEMSSQGTITADIIKNAMFASADQIESKFAKMPKTFSDYWTLIKNKGLQAFTPIIEKINKIINTPQFEEFFNNLMVFIQLSAEAVNWLIDGTIWLCQVMEPLAPIIWGIIGALIAYKLYTALAAAGQWILNAAMSANPTGLLIAGIVALIVALTYLWFTNDEVAYWMLYAWDMLIIGAMALLLGCKAAFYGIIITALYMYEGILGVKMGLQTAFYAIIIAGQTMALGFQGVFEAIVNAGIWMYNKIAEILNKLGGSFSSIDYADFTSGTVKALSNTMGDYANAIAETYGEMEDISSKISGFQNELNDAMYNGATNIQNKVIEFENTRQDRTANRNNWLVDVQDKINGALDVGNSLASKLNSGSKNAIPVEANGGSVDSVNDDVSISDEDLKYMKDFAEQEYINKFTTATLAPNVNISFGDVHETADVEELKSRIAEILEEEIAEVAEGVYD